jgi:hypothetical protein
MNREVHVRFRERLRGKFPRATRPAGSRDRFKGLPAKDQKDVIVFLGNQVLYLNTADPGKTPDGLSSDCEVKN